MNQLSFLQSLGETAASENEKQIPELSGYNYFVVAFSGGKDSAACLLHLIEQGIHPAKIELWHHDVDGGSPLMDWPVTTAYCKAVAQAFQTSIYFSWREGGFKAEMLRQNVPTAEVVFEKENGILGRAGGQGDPNTRMKFPQVSANLAVRWCSSALKIDVGSAAMRNQNRFKHHKTLFITGERAQESASRAKYKTFERHRTDTRDGTTARHVDHWRPIHKWSEDQVWAILERHRLRPHPAYELGISRCSCAFCIFSGADQWATLKAIWPDRFEEIASLEEGFGVTIQRSASIRQLAAKGKPYAAAIENPSVARLALSEHYELPIIVEEGTWTLPPGAFKESGGPT